MNKQIESFSFTLPINLIEEGKWSLAVTGSEATNSVLHIPDENNSFSIGPPGYCRFPKHLTDGIIVRLNGLLEL